MVLTPPFFFFCSFLWASRTHHIILIEVKWMYRSHTSLIFLGRQHLFRKGIWQSEYKITKKVCGDFYIPDGRRPQNHECKDTVSSKIAFGSLLSENERTGPHKLTPQPKGHRTLGVGRGGARPRMYAFNQLLELAFWLKILKLFVAEWNPCVRSLGSENKN
jgi:hypothetical protein